MIQKCLKMLLAHISIYTLALILNYVKNQYIQILTDKENKKFLKKILKKNLT